MADYVLTKWYASETPLVQSGEFVSISGRTEGIVSFLLTLVRVSPRIHFSVTNDRVLLEIGSLEGFHKRTIPLPKISSCYYGYSKPWKPALGIGFFLAMALSVILSNLGGIAGMFGFSIGVSLGVLYYILNKKLTLAVVEDGGHISGFSFKRSVIEGTKISELEAEVVCDIIQRLVDSRVAGTAFHIQGTERRSPRAASDYSPAPQNSDLSR